VHDGLITHAEPVMGTVVSFQVATGGLGEALVRAAIREASALLHHDDEVFSTWKPQSPMSRIRRGELDPVLAPPEVGEVLELCARAHELSDGWFDADAMPGGIDPTGLVKGWSAERALGLLSRAGVASAMVNAGGDIACFGSAPGGGSWRIGIRHPWRADALACVLEVDAAVATSGEYERGRHLVDPPGREGNRPASATVTGPSCALADALATALAVGGDDAFWSIAALEGYEAYLIRADGSEELTGGIRVVGAAAGP